MSARQIATLPPASTTTIRYDAMCKAIAAAYQVDEAKDIRDKALAIEVYARQAKNVEAERQACEIRLRGERRCGQLLKTREKQNGARGVGSRPTSPPPQQPLSDLGISHNQSSQWQKLAAVPDADFEKAVSAPGAKPTTNGIIAAHAEPKRDQVDATALWVWGRLLDFERQGLLATDPNDLLTTMLDHMKASTRELAPKVAAWLGRLAQ